MNFAERLVAKLLETPAPTVEPPPTKTPTKEPKAPPAPSKPRPGTRPWKPTHRPGVVPKPKAKEEEQEQMSFAEADQSVPVPPPPHEDAGGPEPAPMPSLSSIIRPGDRVTIHVPAGIGRNGQEWKAATGRAVMRSSHGGWVLNMGGPHGTPGIADDENIIQVKRGGKVIYGRQ